MPTFHRAIFRTHDHLGKDLQVAHLVAMRDKISKQGSHGVLLKTPDRPEVVKAVTRLQHKGNPVVTLLLI